jgi:copper chaperone
MERNITMQTELLKVTGMTCGGCTSNVTDALKAINGVRDVKVSLSASEATVQYDERLTSSDQLKSALKNAGYGVDGTSTAPGRQSKGGCCG